MTARRTDPPIDPRAPGFPLLVVRAQQGERAALNALLAALQQPLWSHVRVLVKDDDLALDILQETMLTIARKLRALRDPRWIRAWSVRIATRQATRQLARSRRRGEQVASDDLLETVQAPTDEPLFEPELIDAIPALVAELPPACHVVVRLRYLEELSVGEIAQALEIPEGTVKSRLAYGLARLRELSVSLPGRN
jgi:RNA polymerase sigma-70 factor (ECF subfamily)